MDLNDQILACSIVAAMIIAWFLFLRWRAANGPLTIKFARESALDKRNRIKEASVLNMLLNDMTDNPHNWTYNGPDFSALRSPAIINDRKGMAIILSGDKRMRDTTSIAIHFCLRDVAKYREVDENTVVLGMYGKHVSKFLAKAEDCLDVRGKELDFFNNQIKAKL